MTAHALYDFTVTVVPPAGESPSTHKLQGTSAPAALSAFLWQIENCPMHVDHAVRNITEITGVARVMVDGTIYIAAPTNPKPVASAPERDPKTGIQKWPAAG